MVMLLSIAMVIMLLMGAASIGAYLVLSRDIDRWPAGLEGSMQEWVPATAIDDSLALLILAGWTEQSAIDLSMAEGELDTALSLLAHSATLSDRERAGILLRLGVAYRDVGREDVASNLYNKVGHISMLSPMLSTLTRIELLTEAGAGLLRLGENDRAIHLLDQGALLVLASRDLRPAQRRQSAASLLELYGRAGASQSEVAKKLDALPEPPGDRVPASQLATPLEAAVIAVDAASESERVGNTADELRLAIEEWLRYREEHRGERSPALISSIEEALLEYDVSIRDFLQGDSGSEIEQMGLRVFWLARKAQIAKGQLGISLVSQWEEQLSQIQMELASARRAYYDLRQSALLAGPSQDWERADWEVSLACAEVLAGELGLFTDHDNVQAAIALQAALERRNEMLPARDWTLEVSIRDGKVDYSFSFS